MLMRVVEATLTSLGVTCSAPATEFGQVQLKIRGLDMRKELFKGMVVIQDFTYKGAASSFCNMAREKVRSLRFQ